MALTIGPNRVTASEFVDVEWTCRNCGFKSRVEAQGTDQERPSNTFSTESIEKARATASAVARIDARFLVGLARCPACGKLDPDARRQLALRSAASSSSALGFALFVLWGSRSITAAVVTGMVFAAGIFAG